MKSAEIRAKFLDFFENKGHEIVASGPMVHKDDPTLMFTNAGMNQFKDIFLANSEAKHTRVANTQKCLRVSGKHNDLEEVGVDTYHHTMFEMLGNWSFGDYFKEDAIAWAWELLTDVLGLDKDRLYVTIFQGDETDGLEEDGAARYFWERHVPAERILAFDKKDNFWEMGEQGPCGPCSEIHIDLRPESARKTTPGQLLVNKDHPQVIEIWNLVFMEFNRKVDRSLEPLPNKHVDTGMGFERLAAVMQGKSSTYDSDVFKGLLDKVEDISGLRYRPEETGKGQEIINVAFRVIVDHIRAIAFAIADGQLPSNTGAGYVIRRILRRAVRYGYQSLNLKEPFLHRLVPVISRQFESVFPELVQQKELIEKVIREEEVSFFRTLDQGLKKIDQICIDLNTKGEKVVPGKDVFELYDTYGFPVDLTGLIAKSYELGVDEEGFQAELQVQKDRSKKDADTFTEDWVVLKDDPVEEFIGYDHTSGDVHITRYRKVIVKGEDRYQLVFNFTPFYPEGGGQVGDIGKIASEDETVAILDTRKENRVIIHITEKLPEDPWKSFHAQVDVAARQKTMSNHTATHLLHYALRKVLGDHVEQKGSLVNDHHLRFDFSHFQKVEHDEINKIEAMVNDLIQQNLELQEDRAMPLNQAREMGAMALFGEKYDDVVRVIQFGDSIELCGGTHVQATGQVGLFKIRHESAVAAGIRRIEAITSSDALAFVNDQIDTLNLIRQEVKSPQDPLKAIKELMKRNSELEKKLESANAKQAGNLKGDLVAAAEEVGGVRVIASRIDLQDSGAIKKLAFSLKDEENLYAVLAADLNGKPNLTVVVSSDLVEGKGMHAGNIVKELAKEIKGGGGGQPFYATAGGSDVEGLDRAVERAGEFL